MKRVYTATEDQYAGLGESARNWLEEYDNWTYDGDEEDEGEASGWSESKSSEVLQVCDKIYNLDYELRNCVKGAYTGAKTYPELAEYIVSLGEELIEAGENMKYRG